MARPGMRPQKAAEIFPENNDNPLKQLRLRRGLSQSELATAAGLSLNSIRGYEQGTRDINKATLETLCGLALALDCTIGDLITDINLSSKFIKAK